MTGIDEMTMEDISKFREAQKWTQATGREVSIMVNLVTKYIDPKCHICNTCSNQIRLAHGRMKDFYNRNIDLINAREKELREMHQCLVCGTKIEDRRKSYCTKECKDVSLKERREKDEIKR
jgi:hypothetical protein